MTKENDSGTSAGAADRLASIVLPVNTVPGETGRVFTAVRANRNRLKVIAWSVAESGAIARVEDFSDTPGPGRLRIRALSLPERGARSGPALSPGHVAPRYADAAAHGLAEDIVISTLGILGIRRTSSLRPRFPWGRIVLLTGDKPPDYVTRDLLDPAGAGFAHTAVEQRGSFPVSPALPRRQQAHGG